MSLNEIKPRRSSEQQPIMRICPKQPQQPQQPQPQPRQQQQQQSSSMGATTTSISNKIIATTIPTLTQFNKGNEASFANMFADETEASKMGGLLINDQVMTGAANFAPYHFFATSGVASDNNGNNNNNNNTGVAPPPGRLPGQVEYSQPQTQQQQQCYKAIALPSMPQHHRVVQMRQPQPQNDLPQIVPMQAHSQMPAHLKTTLAAAGGAFAASPHQTLLPATVSSSADVTAQQQRKMLHSQQQQQQRLSNATAAVVMSGVVPASTPTNSAVATPAFLLTVPKSTSSSAAASGNPRSTSTRGRRGKRKNANAVPISEDEEEQERIRRKRERNLREQERSHRITDQIGELRRVLTDVADVKFRKTDKYTILVKAGDCIRQLQSRTLLLDEEHKRLINTISETSELVQSSTIGNALTKDSSSSGVGGNNGGDNTLAEKSSLERSIENGINNDVCNPEACGEPCFDSGAVTDSMALFDYKIVFAQCSAPLAVADLDGKFLDCNVDFEKASGCSSEAMTEFSIFHLLRLKEDVPSVCRAMAAMMEDNDDAPNQVNHWSGRARSPIEPNQEFRINVTLARGQNGNPRFFNCALFAVG